MNDSKPAALRLPHSLQRKLLDFRQRLWTLKSVEAVAVAVGGWFAAYLGVFASDRLWDTTPEIRIAFLTTALLVGCVVPWACYRWIWKHRRLDQLARLLRTKHPAIGDQLLGIIELSSNREEQARSHDLCQAAIAQVAEVAERHDLRNAVPDPRHRTWSVVAAVLLTSALALAVIAPAASGNAWARFLLPWSDTRRYTFTMVEPPPTEQVVPHGESFPLELRLAEQSLWRPEIARLTLAEGHFLAANLEHGTYRFLCPPQLQPVKLRLAVGDYAQWINVDPQLRPELTSVDAQIALPAYLERPEHVTEDVRSGAGTFVQGSRVRVTARASRELAHAEIDGSEAATRENCFEGPWTEMGDDATLVLSWQDRLGLAGPQPFELALKSRVDEAPALMCEGLARQQVVLDSEIVSFQIRSTDDFGVKKVGIEWQGDGRSGTSQTAQGERVLGAGSPTSETLELTGTFAPKTLGIEPQPLQVRIFVEDYRPDRERTYSPSYLFYVLSPEDHAVWLTDQLSKWHRRSLEVRDHEMQLYEANKQLRELAPTELDQAETRRAIERQAAAERTNGRRLHQLVAVGEDLVQQASRNQEFGVGHLEKWAEMLQVLKDISAHRMPSVSDLLGEAAEAEQLASVPTTPQQPSSPQVGPSRTANAVPDAAASPTPKSPAIPSLVDVESSQQPHDPDANDSSGESKSSGGRFGLPVTTVVGQGPATSACPAGQKLDEAVTEQRDLLNEFEKVAEELNRVLANLEGSTLVKRLKAASRSEYQIGGGIGKHITDAFGLPSVVRDDAKVQFTTLSSDQQETMQSVSHIMDDMQAYYERRRMARFKNILEEMKSEDVLGALRDLAEELAQQSGLALAQCDYWSDTLDRWAEDLVDPASGGT